MVGAAPAPPRGALRARSGWWVVVKGGSGGWCGVGWYANFGWGGGPLFEQSMPANGNHTNPLTYKTTDGVTAGRGGVGGGGAR
jgi:hypothetical protein